MSGEVEHGKQFARDLCSIRRARGVSLTDIHEATRMAYDLIKRFEHDALIDHPQFNRVYIRVFVRGYATRLGIDAKEALDAFERAMQGKYDGSLAREYLEKSGEPPSEKEAQASSDAPEASEPKASAPGPKASAPGSKASAPGSKASAPGSKASAPGSKASAPGSKASAPGSEAAAPTEADPELPTEESSEKSDEPAAMARPREEPLKPLSKVPPASAASSKGASALAPSASAPLADGRSAGRKASAGSKGRLDARWVFMGLLLVVVALVIWNLARAMSSADEADQAVPSPAAPTSSVHAPTEAIGAFRLPLPDTLAITVVADKGSVAPIRVTLDDDVRRPHWIERGDAETFRIADRIILEQQLDSVTVQVEGVAYPLSRPAGQDSVILTRATLVSWASSLSQ